MRSTDDRTNEREPMKRLLLIALLGMGMLLTACTPTLPNSHRPGSNYTHHTTLPTNCAPGYGCWVITCQEDDPYWDQGETGIKGGCPKGHPPIPYPGTEGQYTYTFEGDEWIATPA